MKTISLVQPYAAMACVSADYGILMKEPTEHRGKVLVCAGNECVVPNFDGIILNHAVCVMELQDCTELTEEQLAEMENTDKKYVWTLANPKMIVPFEVEAQEGLFDQFVDIEYIGTNAQFRKAYTPFSNEETPVELNSLYTLIMESHFPEPNNDMGGMSPFGF